MSWWRRKIEQSIIDGLSIKVEYNALGKRWFYLELKGMDVKDLVQKFLAMFSKKD